MIGNVTILRLADRTRWECEWRNAGLASQSWHYAWALSASGIDPQLAIVSSGSDRLLLPFFERKWKDTIDIATLPGLSGASVAPGSYAPLDLWQDYAASRGWVAGYIQLAATSAPERLSMGSRAVAHNSVFLLDVQSWDLKQTASRTIRRKVRSVEAGEVALVEDRPILSHALRRLYPLTMQRVSGRTAFSSETLRRWAMAPDAVVLGAACDGAIEAVHLGHVAGHEAEWHIAATSDAHRDLGVWLYCKGIMRLRQLGVRVLNLGGGARQGDGIHNLKQWLGGRAVPLISVRQIYDRAVFESLCEHIGGWEEDGGWFPPYRNPALSFPSGSMVE